MGAMEIKEMLSDEEVDATCDVMRQLRTQLEPGEYVERVKRIRDGGYRLVAVIEDGRVHCVAGFRVQEFLYAGRHLYVDDLITDGDVRSSGHGKMMLGWLVEEARRNGCEQFHLDSGVQRGEAHRFYFREGMRISSFHFFREI
jgi:GNAT superfamily N-acetyltransferase